ncbi:MAG: hypothetical protein GY932_14495 [Arcobacter sp.]|nr:hypothetical protein [Arcobacter sp.]
MFTRVILISLLIFLFSCTEGINPAITTPEELKAEATYFALTIVESFLNSDSTYFKSILPDSIYFLETWEKPISTSELNITEFFTKMDYSQYTLDDYKDTYSYKILHFDEYSIVEEGWIDKFIYWKPDAEDYIFWGNVAKEGKQKFPSSDIFVFMVSKRSSVWRFRAFSG